MTLLYFNVNFNLFDFFTFISMIIIPSFKNNFQSLLIYLKDNSDNKTIFYFKIVIKIILITISN